MRTLFLSAALALTLSAWDGQAGEEGGEKKEKEKKKQEQKERKQQQSEKKGGKKEGKKEARTVEVTASGHEFSPDYFYARTEERLRIKLVNDGDKPHSIEFHLPDGEQELGKRLQGGDSGEMTLTAPSEPGQYLFYCPVGNHKERGMQGQLIVVGKQETSPRKDVSEKGDGSRKVVKGTVERFAWSPAINVESNRREHLILASIRQEDGEMQTVSLGPDWPGREPKIRRGDKVALRGVMGELDEVPMLVVQEFKRQKGEKGEKGEWQKFDPSPEISRQKDESVVEGTIEGFVAASRKDQKTGKPEMVTVAEIRERGGSVRYVSLGTLLPWELDVSRGDRVAVRGEMRKIDNQPLLVVQEIKRRDKEEADWQEWNPEARSQRDQSRSEQARSQQRDQSRSEQARSQQRDQSRSEQARSQRDQSRSEQARSQRDQSRSEQARSQQRDQSRREQARSQSDQETKRGEHVFRGHLEDFKKVDMEGFGEKTTLVKLRLENGRSIVADLGPNFSKKDINLKKVKEEDGWITMRGKKRMVKGKPVLQVDELGYDEQLIRVDHR